MTPASPEQVRAARLAGATLALRRLLGDEHDMTVAAAAALTGRCVAALPLPGRRKPRLPQSYRAARAAIANGRIAESCADARACWPRQGRKQKVES